MPHGTRLLAAVPVCADGRCWLLACEDGVRGARVLPGEGAGAGEREDDRAGPLAAWQGVTGWDRVTRARWDAQTRSLVFHILHEDEERVVVLPAALRQDRGDGVAEERRVDESAFSLAVRQQVERAIVYYVSQTLASGVRVTASVRRRTDGGLYSVLDPAEDSTELARQQEEARALLRRVREGVGLPTH